MATRPCTCSRSASTLSTLPAGKTESNAPVSPSSPAIRATGPGASPLTSQLSMPRARRFATAWRLSGRSLSARAATPTSLPSMATQTRVAPSASSIESTVSPRLAIRAGLPMATLFPSTSPIMPLPTRTSTPSGSGRETSAWLAIMARARGCSLACCRAAARRSCSSVPLQLCNTGLPSVRVPVLSKMTALMSWAFCNVSTSLIRMPWRAATPVPVTMAAGVARPRAQGQAMTSTATAANRAWPKSPAQAHHSSRVSRATAITRGTNTAETRSTSCCRGALPIWARSTRAMILLRLESSPTVVAVMVSTPEPLMAPPSTGSPIPRGTGMLSPVSMDSSSSLLPWVMVPSTGTRSPANTRMRSPRSTSSTATLTQSPLRCTVARSGRSAISSRMADWVLRRARASSSLPREMRVMMRALASK